MTSRAGRKRRNSPAGFTLLELMLAIGILVLLAGLASVSVGPRREQARFEEAVERLATALRMARADAANLGLRLQIAFDEAEEAAFPAPHVLWEPAPLAEPNRFSEYTVATWLDHLPGEEVRILCCRRVGPSAYRTLSGEPAELPAPGESVHQSVMFYADGSCDSAVMELAPAEEDRAFRAAVRLDGLSGAVAVFFLTDEQLEENREPIDQGTYVEVDENELAARQ